MATALVMLLDARELVYAVDDALLQSLANQLAPAEQARLPGFVRQQRRREFILGRLLLRVGVARVASCTMQQIEVIERAGAGPQVMVHAAAGDPVRASLSHGGGWIACAIGTDGALGVDIEAGRPGRDLAALASAAFSSGERRWLAAQGDFEQAFYQLWCGKESRYKYGNNATLPAVSGLPRLRCDDPDAAPQAAEATLELFHRSEAGMHLALCCEHDTEVITEKITAEDLLKRFTQGNK